MDTPDTLQYSITKKLILRFTLLFALISIVRCSLNQNDLRFNRILLTYLDYYQHQDPEFLAINSVETNLPQLNQHFFTEWITKLEGMKQQIAEYDSLSLNTNHNKYLLLRNHVNQKLFQFKQLAIWEQDPAYYIEILGNSFFWPLQDNNLSEEQKSKIIYSRLKQIPEFIQNVQLLIKQPTNFRVLLAQEKLTGLIDYFENDLDDFCRQVPDLTDSLRFLIKTNVTEFKQFNQSLSQGHLPFAPETSYLNTELFSDFLKIYFGDELTIAKLQDLIESETQKTLQELDKTAFDVYRRYFSRRRFSTDTPEAREELQAAAIDYVRNKRVESKDFINVTQHTLAKSEQFLHYRELIRKKNNLNFEIVLLPPFKQELFCFETTGKQSSNPRFYYLLNPGLRSWKWPQVLAFSKYNNQSRLAVQAICTLIPGRYLQAAYTDSLADPAQLFFGDLSTIEGWGLYAALFMRKAGFNGYDPAFRLEQLRAYLELLQDAKCAIDLHYNNFTPNEIQARLKDSGLDEPLLSYHWYQIYQNPARLIARIWGFTQFKQLNHDYRVRQGNFYSQVKFNNQIITSGVIPIPQIREKLLPARTQTTSGKN